LDRCGAAAGCVRGIKFPQSPGRVIVCVFLVSAHNIDMRRTLFLVAVAVLDAGAQSPAIDQSLNLKTASAPRISPDGRYVAYLVQEADWDENTFKTEIWLAMRATGEHYQLTKGKKSSTNPDWSPDGKLLAFVSDRDGKRQIYVISPTGGEATQLTSAEAGVANFRWSPDGSAIAYSAPEPESKARKDRKEKYGEFEIVKGDYTMSHLWVVKLPADPKEKPKPERLTEGIAFTVTDLAWSPDSKRIAFSAARDPDLSSRQSLDVYALRLSDKYLKKLTDANGPDSNPVWSPDGRQIAYETAAGREFYYYVNSRIAVIPADGGNARILTDGFDEHATLIAWAADGIYFSALQRMWSHLFRLDPTTMQVKRLTEPHRSAYSAFTFTRDYREMSFMGAGSGQYTEIYTSSLGKFEASQLTRLGDQLRPFRLATREIIEWKSIDGTLIEGVLIKPPDYDPGKKYPLLVVIHGGPAGVDRPVIMPERYYPIEKFAAKGALILRPNYRGSAGYGEKFRSLNVRNLGVGDYQDVISGVDHLVAKGMVDRDRVGAMGWSQGGYISAFITTSSDRFKAVSVGAGISNWTTYYVNTDIHPFTRQYLKATPWDDPEIYRKTSPISYVKTARTPTLIQHGELDKRVPIPNAYELYQALADRGVPVKFIVYKGFGHGIDKPKQQRAVMEHNYEWFSQWIWGEKAALATE
jgi:dipeptidyl aminopeptidase/acylaminoacyl peptidase